MMLEYITLFYTNVVSMLLGILKFVLAKFFAYLAVSMIAITLFFIEVAWEAAKEFITLSDMNQYIATMYSYLPPEVSALFSAVGLFDFLSFLLVAVVARAISGYIPFSKF